jgi:hypothetical protein
MKNHARLAAALLCLALGACADSALSVVCPGEPRPALLITVLDAKSRASVTLEARGWWSTGTAAWDSMRHVPSPAEGGGVVLAAFGPPGIYDVRVERLGYADWNRSGIVVTEGPCGPSPKDIVADLTLLQ